MRYILATSLIFIAQIAEAEICDFRPSRVAETVGQKAKNTGVGVAVAATKKARAFGIYTLENPVTGVSMLGTGVSTFTTAGTSIASVTSGPVSTVTGLTSAPVTITIVGATAVALGAYEGVCHFRAERITDDAEVLEIVTYLVTNSDPTMFALISEGSEHTTLKGTAAVAREAKVRIASTGVGPHIFDVADLYIVEGVLRHSDALRDTVIGKVSLQVVSIEKD
jgi:hypothetical protein